MKSNKETREAKYTFILNDEVPSYATEVVECKKDADIQPVVMRTTGI